MMHIISDRLKSTGKVGTIGGPLWFIQIWALAYFGHRLSISLATAGLMTYPLNESAPIHHRSLGEKLLRIPTVGRLEPEEFVSFLQLFYSYQPSPSVCYCESSLFVWPSFLSLRQPLYDSSRNLLCFVSPQLFS